MSRYYCHEYPDVLVLETHVIDARPGAVLLERSPFHPGGGGQLADRGVLRWNGGEVRVTGIEAADGRYWHLLAEPVEMAGTVETVVDAEFRSMMEQLHTDTHILNALVFRQFQGALVTGAQLNADGTARMDFDLPDADNDRLRALEPEINDVIRQDLPVRYAYVDRQACGGTHLASTARSTAIRILKIDNKGRHNRRIKIGLTGEPRG
jgi:misacylated tRNA(Ala) deacylase